MREKRQFMVSFVFGLTLSSLQKKAGANEFAAYPKSYSLVNGHREVWEPNLGNFGGVKFQTMRFPLLDGEFRNMIS